MLVQLSGLFFLQRYDSSISIKPGASEELSFPVDCYGPAELYQAATERQRGRARPAALRVSIQTGGVRFGLVKRCLACAIRKGSAFFG